MRAMRLRGGIEWLTESPEAIAEAAGRPLSAIVRIRGLASSDSPFRNLGRVPTLLPFLVAKRPKIKQILQKIQAR
jgi:hypothetical protein